MATVVNKKVRIQYNNGLSPQGKNKQSGFTLIEIAIVLVIIGLLLGGVLKGQELINTARVRALSNNIDGITSAWFSFSDRYRAFPGDYNQASVNLPNILNDGDGNGLVGLKVAVDDPEERGLVWAHLQAAGYITGSFPDATAPPQVTLSDYGCSTTICPDNGFGRGMVIQRSSMQRSGAGTPAAHELLTGAGIPSDVLAELDRKIDDGTPGAGSMQLGLTGTGFDDVEACVVTGTAPAPDVYNMQTPSDNCAAVFRNF